MTARATAHHRTHQSTGRMQLKEMGFIIHVCNCIHWYCTDIIRCQAATHLPTRQTKISLRRPRCRCRCCHCCRRRCCRRRCCRRLCCRCLRCCHRSKGRSSPPYCWKHHGQHHEQHRQGAGPEISGVGAGTGFGGRYKNHAKRRVRGHVRHFSSRFTCPASSS